MTTPSPGIGLWQRRVYGGARAATSRAQFHWGGHQGPPVLARCKDQRKKGSSNVAFLRTKIEFVQNFFAAGEVSEIWLTFSDPQPKDEKGTKRITSEVFLRRYRQFMVAGWDHSRQKRQPAVVCLVQGRVGEGGVSHSRGFAGCLLRPGPQGASGICRCAEHQNLLRAALARGGQEHSLLEDPRMSPSVSHRPRDREPETLSRMSMLWPGSFLREGSRVMVPLRATWVRRAPAAWSVGP